MSHHSTHIRWSHVIIYYLIYFKISIIKWWGRFCWICFLRYGFRVWTNPLQCQPHHNLSRNVPLLQHFSDCYFTFVATSKGFKNFSLGKGVVVEVNCSDDDQRRSLRYGLSGLEMYVDYNEELSTIALDLLEIIGFNHHIEESKWSDEVSGGNGFELEVMTWLPTCKVIRLVDVTFHLPHYYLIEWD